MAPSVTENEDVVGCDTEHDEDGHLVERRVHCYAEQPCVEQVGHGETEEDEQHGYEGHEEAPQMEHDVAEDENNAEDSPLYVIQERLAEELVIEQLVLSGSLDCAVLRLVALAQVEDLVGETDHDILLGLLVIFQTLKSFVLTSYRASYLQEGAHVGDIEVVFADILIEEQSELTPEQLVADRVTKHTHYLLISHNLQLVDVGNDAERALETFCLVAGHFVHLTLFFRLSIAQILPVFQLHYAPLKLAHRNQRLSVPRLLFLWFIVDDQSIPAGLYDRL